MNEDNYWRMKYGESQVDSEAAETRFVMSFGGKLVPDGDQFCILIGSNLTEGICAFGKSPMEAVNEMAKLLRTGKTEK